MGEPYSTPAAAEGQAGTIKGACLPCMHFFDLLSQEVPDTYPWAKECKPTENSSRNAIYFRHLLLVFFPMQISSSDSPRVLESHLLL